MASSGGAGGDVPAERAAAAVNDLIEVREGAVRLKSLLQEQSLPWTGELIDAMLSKLSNALSALDTGAGTSVRGGQNSAAGSAADGVIRQTAESSAVGTRKRSFSRRSQRPCGKRVTATLDDGHIWRKYGQKEIQNSPHQRSYYRCTHKSDQGCKAKRHVQLCDTDPSKYVVTYYVEHTCRDPSTNPMIVDTAGAAVHDRVNSLISFAPSYTTACGGAGAGSSYQFAKEGGTTHQLSSSWCTSDDVFSSSAEPFVEVDELAAVVGSAGMTSSTVGSAPDYGGLGDMAGGRGGGGTGSFPSSPSSLGFVAAGSLGSIGDDDFFRFDP